MRAERTRFAGWLTNYLFISKGERATKKNQCGSKSISATRNLLITVMDDRNIMYGIPPYNQDKMIHIIESAIKDKALVELFYKCYGLNGRQRKLQKDVATEANLPDYQVSNLVKECITKLRQSPFKRQLCSLMASEEELFDKATRTENAERQLEVLQAEIARLQAEISQLQDENSNLQAENSEAQAEIAQLTGQNEILSKECAESWKQVKRAKAESKEKEEQAALAIAKAETVYKAFTGLTSQMNELAESASIGLTREVSKETAKVFTFGRLGLEESVVSTLHRAGIKSVSVLCSLNKNSLRRLGVSVEEIKTIIKALAKHGLSLKDA